MKRDNEMNVILAAILTDSFETTRSKLQRGLEGPGKEE